MDFSFTDEQKQLADAVRRFIDKDYGFEARNKVVYSPEGVSQAAWDGLAELGLTALPVPEAQGGFDGRAMDLLVVISNCPERDNLAAGGEPTPVRAIVYSPA